VTIRTGILALLVLLAGSAGLYELRRDRVVVQPKIYVSTVGSTTQFMFAPETCPDAAFVFNESDVHDYGLSVGWDSSGWSPLLDRNDGVLLISDDDASYSGRDFKVVLRRACSVIMRDAERWARDQAFVLTVVCKFRLGRSSNRRAPHVTNCATFEMAHSSRQQL
jgi:hypothetical protein